MNTPTLRARRGASILELLMASALLLFALVGIVSIMSRGAQAGREGQTALNASLYAQEALTQTAVFRYSGMVPGVYDGGEVFDSGGRRYGRIVTITPGTAVTPSYDVQVTVDYLNSSQAPFQALNRTVSTMIVSRLPDGG